jgi:hypothetical protein
MDRGMEERVLIPGRGKIFFCTPQRPDRIWGPPSLLALWPGIKPPGREADQSPPSNAEVGNSGAILPLLHTRLHGLVLN